MHFVLKSKEGFTIILFASLNSLFMANGLAVGYSTIFSITLVEAKIRCKNPFYFVSPLRVLISLNPLKTNIVK